MFYNLLLNYLLLVLNIFMIYMNLKLINISVYFKNENNDNFNERLNILESNLRIINQKNK